MRDSEIESSGDLIQAGGPDSREYPARPIVGVGAVVLVTPADCRSLAIRGIDAPHGVVLIKRRYEPLAGRWSLPGGTVEVGETLEASVAREIEEETGLVCSIGQVIEVFDRILHDQNGRVRFHFVLVDYLCRPTAGTLRHGSDADDVVVAEPARLDEYSLTDKALAVIERGLALAAQA